MRARTLPIMVLALCAVVRCGATGPALTETSLADQAQQAPPPAPEPPRPPGTVYRDELEAAQKKGPQRFIQRLKLRPTFHDGRFDGFRVVQLDAGLMKVSEVRPGDVVKRVNGLPVERPDQFMKVWESLKGANKITFDVVRAGRAMTITYTVVDRPPMPEPEFGP